MPIKRYIRVSTAEHVDSPIAYHNDVRPSPYIRNCVYNTKYLNVHKIILMYLLSFSGYGFLQYGLSH